MSTICRVVSGHHARYAGASRPAVQYAGTATALPPRVLPCQPSAHGILGTAACSDRLRREDSVGRAAMLHAGADVLTPLLAAPVDASLDAIDAIHSSWEIALTIHCRAHQWDTRLRVSRCFVVPGLCMIKKTPTVCHFPSSAPTRRRALRRTGSSQPLRTPVCDIPLPAPGSCLPTPPLSS